MRHRLVGMVQDGLRIDAAGGVDRSLACKQRAELVERGEVRRVPLQDCDKGFSRLKSAIERAEQACALDFGQKPRVAVGRARQLPVELAQPGLLCEARGPGSGRGGVLFRGGHGWANPTRLFRAVLSTDSRAEEA